MQERYVNSLKEKHVDQSIIDKIVSIPDSEVIEGVWSNSNNFMLKDEHEFPVSSTFTGVTFNYPNICQYHGLDVGLTFVISTREMDGRILHGDRIAGLFMYYLVNIHGVERKIFIKVQVRDLAMYNLDERITNALQTQKVYVDVEGDMFTEWIKSHAIIEKEFNVCIPVNLDDNDKFGFTVKGALDKYDILYIDPIINPVTIVHTSSYGVVHFTQVVTKYGTYPLIYWLTLSQELKGLHSLDPIWELKPKYAPLQNEIIFSIPVPTSIVRFIRKWKINTNIFKVT